MALRSIRGQSIAGLGLALGCGALLSLASGPASACPPDGWSREALLALKSADWKLDDAKREALAVALLPCLASPDPVLRDSIAFEGLSAWMRAGSLANSSLRNIMGKLLPQIAPGRQDAAGFAQPFAALALSEVARVERLHPFLAREERMALLDGAVGYLSGVRDYRGFDRRDGWRHGVAHGADLLAQLALDPAFGRAEHDKMLGALASQVAPAGEHFYIYGEPERLARPVLLIARRATMDAAAWNGWIARVAAPAPFASWDVALQSQAGLARRHNAASFLLVLYASLHEGTDEAGRRALLPALAAALRNMP